MHSVSRSDFRAFSMLFFHFFQTSFFWPHMMRRQFISTLVKSPIRYFGTYRYASTASSTTTTSPPMATSRFHTATGDDVFCKIIRGELPSTKRYEDDFCIAFDDINPDAPVHILVIPKLHTRGISNLFGSQQEEEEEAALPYVSEPVNDVEIVGKLFAAAAKVAEAVGIDKTGYRLVINNGADGGQTVFHLHLHLIGGRKLTWPPG